MASGVTDLLMCLKEFHVTVHLPGPVLHQLHHLTRDLDLLVAQLLAPNQGPLNAVQHSPPLGAVRLPLELLMILIQFLQDFLVFRVNLLHQRDVSLQIERQGLDGVQVVLHVVHQVDLLPVGRLNMVYRGPR